MKEKNTRFRPVCLLLFLATVFIFSCSSDGRNASGKLSVQEPGGRVPDTTKVRLLQIIRGGWLSEEYMHALEKYQSPMEAAAYGLPEQQMAFDISQLHGDTLVNFLGRMHYREGDRFELVFNKKSDGKTSMYINEDRNYTAEPLQMNYEISGKDTILLLRVTGEHTKRLRYRRVFRHFSANDGSALPAMEMYINRRLFAGAWVCGNDTIRFTESGKLKKFPGFNRYAVVYLADNPGSQHDEISFFSDTAGVTYAFTLRQDKLSLYEIEDTDDPVSFSRGRLVYSFARLREEQ